MMIYSKYKCIYNFWTFPARWRGCRSGITNRLSIASVAPSIDTVVVWYNSSTRLGSLSSVIFSTPFARWLSIGFCSVTHNQTTVLFIRTRMGEEEEERAWRDSNHCPSYVVGNKATHDNSILVVRGRRNA